MPTSARQVLCARQSADRCGRRAACPHAAETRCIVVATPVVAGTLRRGVGTPPYGLCVRRRYIRHGGTGGYARPYDGAFGDGAYDVGTERADVGIDPYGVRSATVRPRADIQSAPTALLPAFS